MPSKPKKSSNETYVKLSKVIIKNIFVVDFERTFNDAERGSESSPAQQLFFQSYGLCLKKYI